MPPRPHHRRNREQAAEALGRVAPLVSRWVERLLATTERPLTLAQYLTLQAVAEGKLVGADLARQTAVSPSAVAQLLASLETAGLIARRRGSDDRRRQELALTELGTHALVAAQALVRDELGSLLADLPPGNGRARPTAGTPRSAADRRGTSTTSTTSPSPTAAATETTPAVMARGPAYRCARPESTGHSNRRGAYR